MQATRQAIDRQAVRRSRARKGGQVSERPGGYAHEGACRIYMQPGPIIRSRVTANGAIRGYKPIDSWLTRVEIATHFRRSLQ